MEIQLLAEGPIHKERALRIEYGLRPIGALDHLSWGVAPGYGENRPSANRAEPKMDNFQTCASGRVGS